MVDREWLLARTVLLVMNIILTHHSLVLGCLRLLHVRIPPKLVIRPVILVRSQGTNYLYSVAESLVSVVYWFPFYFTFKFIFLLWLSLPAFK